MERAWALDDAIEPLYQPILETALLIEQYCYFEKEYIIYCLSPFVLGFYYSVKASDNIILEEPLACGKANMETD